MNKKEKLDKLVENHYKILFSLILLLAIILNIYKLGEIPKGINVDEAGMAYDAYSIAGYGVDRFLNHLPVYLINFGGGQSSMYAYLTAIVIKCAGGMFNSIILRIPAVILSVLEVIVAYLLVKEFYSKKQALLFMLLVTISPWHIMKSRWGLDAYLLSPMLLFSIYALMKAIKNKSHTTQKVLCKETVTSHKVRDENNIIGFMIAGILFRTYTLYLYTFIYSSTSIVIIDIYISNKK